ncbi:Hypothetical protein A7982_09833 [Minicystis rosea]|nr:Hypothetical protein A7982_09833 [Minicystis rosea]
MSSGIHVRCDTRARPDSNAKAQKGVENEPLSLLCRRDPFMSIVLDRI